jgi:outer membrane protein OmpU
MRKILLASSALVGIAMLAAPAFAGDLTVKLSGYDSAMLGFNDDGQVVDPVTGVADHKNTVGMDNLFDINVSVEGKGSNNLDYGAMITLWNGPSSTNAWAGGGNAASTNDAYIWLSNNWGKLMLGDAHGASDLFVYAPTVGTNEIDGYYQQFVDLNKVWRALPTFIDNNESSARITYYTPKVSGFQGGISYAPDLYSQGMVNNSVTGAAPTTATFYDNQIEAALGWSGSYDKWGFKVTGLATTAEANQDEFSAFAGIPARLGQQDYLSLGIGAQVNFAGFTVGASYTDPGHYDELAGQDKQQYMATIGGKYDWNQASFAINAEDGEGYNISWSGLGAAALGVAKAGQTAISENYIRDYNAVGFGATYTWFPGLVSGVDVVFFNQQGAFVGADDDGEVVLLSQRVNF